MSKEFGLHPTNREPQMWIGCRAIITGRKLDIPYDRWSTDIKYESGKEDFVWWINNVAIPKIEEGIKQGRKAFWFGSENGLFTCEADDRDSGGYLYCGFYSTKKYDEMIKEEVNMTETTFTAFVYEDDGIIAADLSTYDSKEDAIEFAKARNWDEVVNDHTGEVVWKR